MKTHRSNWVSLAIVIVASSLFGTGCMAETEYVDDNQFDDLGYETEETDTIETLVPTGDDEEKETNINADENWGLCGPKCNNF